jgi:hypothetical protein
MWQEALNAFATYVAEQRGAAKSQPRTGPTNKKKEP